MFFKNRPDAKPRTRSDFLVGLETENRDLTEAGTRRRMAEVKSEEAETDVQQKQLGFQGNPEHLAKLKEGVEAWNKWREENPGVKPDLRGADFTRAEDFKGTPIWGRPDWDKNGPERVLLAGVNLSASVLFGANLSGAELHEANLSAAGFWLANLSRVDFWSANLSGAYLEECNLSEAELFNADLSEANVYASNLSGVNFGLANLTNTNVTSVRYKTELLRRRCHGIRAESCYGNAKFKRDVMDQDYLDQVEGRLLAEIPPRLKASKKRGSLVVVGRQPPGTIWWFIALGNGFAKWRALALGALIGVVISIITLHQGHDGSHRLAGVLETIFARENWLSICSIVVGFVAVAGFFAGTAGKLLIFNLWGLFDFGRSWASVLVFALAMIVLFGAAYFLGDGTLFRISGEDPGYIIWFYPWFVALMGFATLGISSYATAHSSLGAIIIMANVLSGFLTLGLLLSVLGNIFARRA